MTAYKPAWSELVFENRDQWLDARNRLGIGASEVAGLFNHPDNPLRGVSQYESPVSINWRKRGLIQREERSQEEEDHLEWSTEIEPAIGGWFARKVMAEREPFARLHDPGQWTIQVPAEAGVPWFATLDRILLLEDGTPVAPLEIKNASLYMADEWGEEPPLAYTLQVQTQLAVTGLPYGYICASIGGRCPKWKRVNRDEEMIAIIRQRVIEAWNRVLANEDPPMDGHPKTSSSILQRWPQDDKSRVALAPSIAESWDARLALNQQINQLESLKEKASNEVRAAIGKASFGDLPDGRSISYKADKRGVRSLREANS